MVTSLVALIALGLQTAPAAYTLRYVPLINDSAKYSTSMVFSKDGAATTLEQTVLRTVVDVPGDGNYTTRSVSQGSLIRSEGKEVRDVTATSIDMVFAPDGRLTRTLSANAGSVTTRIGAMIRFVAPEHPVKVGDEYEVDRTGDNSGVPSSVTKYKFEKVVGTGTRSLAFLSVNYQETGSDAPATAVGEWQIDTYTGLMVALDLKISGFSSNLGDVTSYHLQKIDQQP